MSNTIHCNTPKEALEAFFREALSILQEEVTRALKYLGEKSVKMVRDREEIDSWYDHTGNLRSSVGYSIYEYGKSVIESTFSPIKGGTEGQSEGKRMVEELASQYSDTYALVVVAAMNYAEYVERIDSKDVLASTELWAKSVVNDYIGKAVKRAERRINKIKIA